MQKIKSLKIALYCIFPLLFNLLFFMLSKGEHPTSSWISYVFIHLAWVLLITTPLLSPQGATSSIFNLSIYGVSFVYFLAELIVGVIIIVQPQAAKGTVTLQGLLLILYVAILIPALLSNEHSAKNTEVIINNSEVIREYCSRISALFNVIPNEEVNRELQRAYNTLHAAPVSNGQWLDSISIELKQLEFEIHRNSPEDALIICKKLQRMT